MQVGEPSRKWELAAACKQVSKQRLRQAEPGSSDQKKDKDSVNAGERSLYCLMRCCVLSQAERWSCQALVKGGKLVDQPIDVIL